MSQIALYIVIYKFIYNYIEAGKAVFIFLNDLMTNDLNDHIFRFSCFVMSMQTAIIQGVKNCLPLGLADGAVSTDPSPTRQKGCRRPTSWARTGSMMLFSTATNLRLGFRKGVISTDTPYKHVDEEDKTPSQTATPLADDRKTTVINESPLFLTDP